MVRACHCRVAVQRVPLHLAPENLRVELLPEQEAPFPHQQVMALVKPLSWAVAVPRNHSEADELNVYDCSKPVAFPWFRHLNADLTADDHSDTGPRGYLYQWEQSLVAKEPSWQPRSVPYWAHGPPHSKQYFAAPKLDAALRGMWLRRRRSIPTRVSYSN